VAAIYWPQVIPYRLPHSGNAVELRQITLPRAAIVSAVSTFRQAAEAVGATSLHIARQRLPRDYEAMLDLVEVTVAAQPAGCDLVTNRGALIPRLRDRLARQADQRGRRFPLCEAADAAGRLGLVFRADDTPVGPLAVYQVAGRLYAIAERCPHAGATLSGGEASGC
jgi:hypothetical protein